MHKVHITAPFQKSRRCNTTFFFCLKYIFLYFNDSEEYSQLSLQGSYIDVLKQSLQCLHISHLKWAHSLFTHFFVQAANTVVHTIHNIIY